MKKCLVLLLSVITLFQQVTAQYVTIPDSNFRNKLYELYPEYFNSIKQLDTTSVFTTVYELDLSGLNISNLEGIQYLTNLAYLGVQNNNLTSLPTKLPNSLLYLDCSYNQLGVLTLPDSLANLICSFNQLSILPQLPKTLKYLTCSNNNLTNLPILPPAIVQLLCDQNPNLSCLPFLPNTIGFLELDTTVKCIPNLPKQLLLDFKAYPPLCNAGNVNSCPIVSDSAQFVVNKDGNLRIALATQIPSSFDHLLRMDTTSIEVRNLKELFIKDFEIKSLEGLHYFTNLQSIDCSNNLLTSIDNLPNNIKILDCSNNKLTQIISLPKMISSLTCYGNPQLFCLPPIPFATTSINIDTNHIKCLPNRPKELRLYCGDMSGFYLQDYPICDKKSSICEPLKDSAHFVALSDPYFRNYLILKSNYQHIDLYGRMDTINNPIFYQKNLSIFIESIDDAYYLKSLDDLKQFKQLEELDASYLYIRQINYLPPTLKKLSLYFSYQLESIKSFPVSIIDLKINMSYLSQLPPLPKSLKNLDCDGNLLTSLPALPDSMVDLDCDNNKLKSLPPLPKTLVFLHCRFNEISKLPSLPEGMEYIACNNNKLKYLPVFPTSLQGISCDFNPDLHCLPYIPPNMTQIKIDTKSIRCVPNKPSNLSILDERGMPIEFFPLCDSSNNSGVCEAYANIQGKVFVDLNHNGILDNTEKGKRNVKVQLTSNLYTITDDNGNFSFVADTLGTYAATLTIPNHFARANSEALVFNLADYGTVLTKNIPIVATDSLDELALSVTNSRAARPGFPIIYQLGYQNTGITNLNSQLSFSFDKNILVIDSLSVPHTLVSDTTIRMDLGMLPSEYNGSLQVYARLKTTAKLGQNLAVAAELSSPKFTIKESNSTIITGSFDPNDKQATENLKPEQLNAGEFITYTIRFQNTGTDTAFTVVVQDTLNQLLSSNSLEVIASSHACKTTVNQGIVSFRFNNILLPDSNRNEPASHGFVKFKVKPVNGIKTTDVVENTAYIYFDYNEPVVTNTVATTFLDLITGQQDATMSSGAYIYPNPAKDKINVTVPNAETLNIYNATGTLVWSEVVIGTQELSISNLKSGLYLFSLGERKGKLIVE